MGFQQGVSGLTVAGRNLDVIGNNVANASTVGAKKARAEFSDLYARASGGGGGGAGSIGLGTSLAAVSQQFSQGSVTATDNPLDIAISGGGFFQLKDLNNATQYSRAGQFKIDSLGNITNNQGSKLLGIPAKDGVVPAGGQPQPLVLSTKGLEPAATKGVIVEANLNAGNTTLDTGASPPIDVNKAATYNSATSVNVYDAKGQEVAVTYMFQKSASDPVTGDTWNITAAVKDGSGTMTAVQAPDGTQWNVKATFMPGTAVSFTPALAADRVFTVPATTGASGALTVPIPGVSTEMGGMTQYAANFGVTNMSQDGYPPGQLSQMKVEANGVLMATYSSGKSQAVGQLQLATFRNEQGLQPLGGNAWGATNASGAGISGNPGSGNLGVVQGGAVEESNVDLTAELVNMMVAQRIYQANAQTIKTQDAVLQTMVNLR